MSRGGSPKHLLFSRFPLRILWHTPCLRLGRLSLQETVRMTELEQLIVDPSFLQAILVFVSMGLALLAKKG